MTLLLLNLPCVEVNWARLSRPFRVPLIEGRALEVTLRKLIIFDAGADVWQRTISYRSRKSGGGPPVEIAFDFW